MPDTRMRPKLLYVVHEAARSGAPILALTFLKWLRRHTQVVPDVLILNDGPLREEFARLATTFVAKELGGGTSAVNKARVRLLGLADDHWIDTACNLLVKNGYQIVYGNSIVCMPWLDRFEGRVPRRVCAVHELTWVIESFLAREYVVSRLPGLDGVAAGSAAVAANLTAEYGVPADRVSVCHAFIEPVAVGHGDRQRLRAEHGIANDTLIIGGMGKPELRKGTDLVAPIAKALQRRSPELRFKLLWVGADQHDPTTRLLRQDVRKLGLDRQVAFVGATSRPDDYIDLFDVFMLPSREDPFPLVSLTAAWFAKPIVAFDRSGGMSELLSEGAGCLVPYLDVDAFAERIGRLAREPLVAAGIGQKVRDRVTAHYTTEVKAPELWRIIAGELA